MFATLIFWAALSQSAFAQFPYFQAFKAAYPNATHLQSCNLCHTQVPQLNPFGIDYGKANHDFKAIENLDSDGDGISNLSEINAGTWPGDKNSHSDRDSDSN